MAGDLFRSWWSHSLTSLKLFFIDDGASKFQQPKDDDVLDVSLPESEEQSHASDNGDDDGEDNAESEASNDAVEPEAEALPTSPTASASRPPNLKSRTAHT